MAMLRVSLLVVALTATTLAAPPPLETQTAGALSLGLPKGWKVTVNTGPAMIFAAQQDPAKADAAAVLVSVVTSGNKTSEDQLIDLVAAQVAKTIKVVKREAVQGGGHMLVADGMAGTVKVRLAAIAIAHGDGAIMGVLVSKVGEFDSLGGTSLLVQILASIKVAAATAPPPATPTTTDRPTSTADLAGVWDNDSASVKQYATTSGTYAGASTVSIRKVYTVSANGSYSEKFTGYQGGTATGGGRVSWQTYTGKFSVLPNGLLEVTVKGAATAYYTIVSYSTTGDVSKLVLAGPEYDKTAAPDPRCPCESMYRYNGKK